MSNVQQPAPGKSPASNHRLLLAMTPGRISESLVHWTHQLATSLNCSWCALYIESAATIDEDDQAQLSRTLSLARSLGAEVITQSNPDVVSGLLRTAMQRNVTQIIVGKASCNRPGLFHWRDKWLDRLLQESGDIGIHVISGNEALVPQSKPAHQYAYGSTIREYIIGAAVILTLAGALTFLREVIGYQAIAWIFLTVIVVMASVIGRGATLLSAVLSALLWDYLFEEPLYSFYITKVEDRILFALYFVIAVLLGQFTARIRRQEVAERKRQERAEALQALTRSIANAPGFDDMLLRACQKTSDTFRCPVALLLASNGRLQLHSASTMDISGENFGIAEWSYHHGQATGIFTVNFPSAPAFYLPIEFYEEKFGVLALGIERENPLTVHQRNLIDAFVEEIGAGIHRYRMREISENSRLLSESERLSKTLLNSISHEIRTPLAVIQAATSHMAKINGEAPIETHKLMIGEIEEAIDRLNRLVGKVLEVTRLESGHVKPRFAPCEVVDLIQTARAETRKELAGHPVSMEIAPDLPAVNMDFELMLHALTNLLSNAASHTPAGTKVEIEATIDTDYLKISVADNGPGIPTESLPRLFDKFYRAPNAGTGGTGLGLSLVKGLTEAHGGHVTAHNRPAGGAVFAICLPAK